MDKDQEIKSNTKRPFFLSILCIAIFSYSTLFILIFLTGILYNKWITKVLNDFLAVGEVRHSFILILSFAGILLYSMSFLGAFLIWKLRRKGFYIYSVSSVLIICLPYFFHFGSLISTIVLLLLIALILLHFRKLN